ncbi:phosphomethylpyrimidine kinase [Anaplasma phagocytophilum str. MRK]|nr:phosphomethylpyrimidine kinase [Anaplasma phagocytophilum str. MRK]
MYKGNVLSIAGSDSGGGAGIQADIKTITMLGCYAATCITAITAQNTQEVRGVWELAPEVVKGQLEAVLDDLKVDAIKIGMLPVGLIGVVAESLPCEIPVILDPVMVSTSGFELTDPMGYTESIRPLAQNAALVTPNIKETEALSGMKNIRTREEIVTAGNKIIQFLGIKAVLVKGGIWEEEEFVESVLIYDGKTVFFRNERAPGELHGTGCTLTSAIACFIARGLSLEESTRLAFDYVSCTIKNAPIVGQGLRPLFHNYFIVGDC